MLQPINASISTKKVIADIGGTNARFALLNENGSIQDQIVLRGADYPDFISAYREYLNKIGNPKVTDAAIAIANPIDGDVIKMTNHDWNFSIKEAQESLLLETLTFKNDFEALAMSIPFLGATGGVFIGGGIVPKLGDYFKSSAFRARFDAKGRFEDYLKEIPVYVIKAKYPALIGIKQVFEFNS